MDVCCECCMLSGRDLCVGLIITRPEQSYRLCCVLMCDLETSWMRTPWPTGGGAVAPETEKDICSPVLHLYSANKLTAPIQTVNWWVSFYSSPPGFSLTFQLKCDDTRWRTGGEVKGKLANGVGGQYSSHYLGTWCIQHYYHYYRWCAQLGCQ
jgi:hypothetical protein